MMNRQKPYDEHIEGIDRQITIRLLPIIAFDIIGYKSNHMSYLKKVLATYLMWLFFRICIAA